MITFVVGILQILTLFALSAVTDKSVYDTEFCSGWADGFDAGYKDVKGQFSVPPATPVCPVPMAGQEPYKYGYNQGFKKGRCQADAALCR